MIEFPKKEILMDYVTGLYVILMGKYAENSEKNPKIHIKFRKFQINPENSNKFK
jgi:hypothetical protein